MHEASLDTFIKIRGEPNCLHVCQSVSWLTSLLKPGKNRDISGSWWYIFLNFFGDIPEMFVHYFQIIKNFLYVCQSISWLTYLLILGQYRDISCFGWDIFLKIFVDIPGMFLNFFQINSNCLYVCQSFSLLTTLQILDKCRDISFSGCDIFLNFFRDIPEMFIHYFQIIANYLYVCQSFSWLTYLLKFDK